MDAQGMVTLIRGAIAELPEDRQSLVQEQARILRGWLDGGDLDLVGARRLALALVGAELSEAIE